MTKQQKPSANILVVDDTKENLRLLVGLLEEHDYEVRPVTNGLQALEAVESDPPDLILLDINMPGMSGYEVCERLKKKDEFKDIPVIFFTALNSTDDKVKAFEVGGVDYVTKPFQIGEVLARVKTHIELKRALTERNIFLRQAQEATASAVSIHRAILESSLDSVVVMNSEGQVVEFNPAAEALFGYQRDQVIGKSLATLIIPPELREGHRQGLKRYLATGQGQVIGRRVEMPALCADGRSVRVELAIMPVPGSNPQLFAGVIRDITARIEAENVLRERETFLRLAQEAAHVGSWEWDIENNKFKWSDELARMHGLADAEFDGNAETVMSFCHPADVESLRDAMEQMSSGAEISGFESRIIRKDGVERVLWFLGQTHRDKEGKPAKVLGIAIDITERKLRDKLLEDETRILGMIAKGADLREILTAIVESIEAISTDTIGSILFLDSDGVHVRHGAAPGLPDVYNQAVNGAEIGPKAGSCGTAAYRRQAVIVTDIMTDPLWEDYRELARLSGLRACWSTPIMDSRESVLGTFAMYYREPRSPSPEDFTLIQRATHLAGVAMERKQDEESLREAQEFNAQVLANTQHGQVVLDSELRYRMWNPAMEQITGLRPEQVLGRTPQELFPFLQNIGIIDAMRRALEGGITHSNDFQYDIPGTDRRGWATALVGPMRNTKGEIIGVINSVIETTSRVQDERFVNTLMDSLPGSVYLFQADGKFLKWNKVLEDVTGYTKEEIAEMSPFTLVQKNEIDGISRMIDTVLSEGQASVESSVLTKDGRTVPYYYKGVRMTTEQGPCVLGIGIDISDRRRLEDQFRQAQKMEAVGQLAGGIAHDFNNLLTIITGYCQLILRSMRSDDPQTERVQEILRAGERSASLTRQLLTFSRKQVLAPKVLSLNEVIYDTEKMLHRLIGEDIQLTTSLHPRLHNVRVDPGQIEQVLLNLAVNARDAMPEGGSLLIETKNVELGAEHSTGDAPANSYVLLTVSDTGKGMTEDIKHRIFEPFFTTKGNGQGTGLGLAVVHGIIKDSDGYIEVESNGQSGTTFSIYLPHSADVVRSATHDSLAPAPDGTETILLVEDEAVVRALSREVLEDSGYKVLEAADVDRALHLSGEYKGKIHLLVTDVVMPGIAGPALAERIVKRFPEIKVLFVSGYTDDAVVKYGVLHDEVNFLQKPFSPDALANKVRDVLDTN